MEYIADKNLYSAVMFALKMCPTIQTSYAYKIRRASNYYHVDYEDVLGIVRKELYERATAEANKNADSWYTIYHNDTEVLGTSCTKNFIFICPRCGARYAFNINDFDVDKRFVSSCRCGFFDKYQRSFVRREYCENKED